MKLPYNVTWVKVDLRIFPTLSKAERYCRRKGIPETEIQYDPEQEIEARVMAAQQIAILNEAVLRINKRWIRERNYLNATVEARNTAQDEINKGNPYPAVFNISTFDRNARESVEKMQGLQAALDEITDIIDELTAITRYKFQEPEDKNFNEEA